MSSLRHVILGRECWQRRENRDSWKPELRLCEDRLPQASEELRGSSQIFLVMEEVISSAASVCPWLILSLATLCLTGSVNNSLEGIFHFVFIFSLEIHLCLSPLGIWFSDCGWSQAKVNRMHLRGAAWRWQPWGLRKHYPEQLNLLKQQCYS